MQTAHDAERRRGENPDRAVAGFGQQTQRHHGQRCKKPCKTCRPIPARASIPCPRRFRASPIICRRCWRAWASSISSSPTRRTPSKASTPSSPAARLRPPHPRQRPANGLGSSRAAMRQRCRQRQCAGPTPSASSRPAAAPPPSADLLYSNGLRDLNGRKYDLATQEFQDYLKYYPDTDLASNAQFYLGEIAFAQEQYRPGRGRLQQGDRQLPEELQTRARASEEGLGAGALGREGHRASANCVRSSQLYPGTDEERRARAKLKELGDDGLVCRTRAAASPSIAVVTRKN